MNVGRALESLRKWTATEQEWRDVLGEEFDDVRPLLSPEGQLAEVIALPGRNELLRVVQHGESDFVAIDPEDPCPAVIAREALVLWQLRPESLLEQLMSAARLRGLIDKTPLTPTLWRLGSWPQSRTHIPVYATLGLSNQEVLRDIFQMPGLAPNRFIAIGLREQPPSLGTQAILRAESAWVGMDEAFQWKSPGELWTEVPLASHLPESIRGPRAGDQRVTPSAIGIAEGTTWGDVELRFLDPDTILCVVDGADQHITPATLDLANLRNGNPTKAWQLLVKLIKDKGITSLTRPTRAEHKHVEEIRKALQLHLRIKGNPIVLSQRTIAAVFRCTRGTDDERNFAD